MVEVDAAVPDLGLGLDGVGHVGGLLQHFGDPAVAGRAHGDHDKDHAQHHQAHQDAHDIAEQAGQVAGGQLPCHDEMGAEPGQVQDAAVDHQHHDGVVEGQPALGFDKKPVELFGRLLELFVLIVLPDEGFDHPDGRDVLLHRGVQVLVPAEHFVEDPDRLAHDQDKGRCQDGDGHQEDAAQPYTDEKTHKHAADQHQGRADRYPQDHLVGVLDVGDVGGHTGDQAGGTVLVDVRKGKGLHLGVDGVPQVAGKAG